MEAKKKKIEHLVVDTTAFLQNVPLHQYAENIYTCQEVIGEVKHKGQRDRLTVLLYDLKIKTVFPESRAAVIEFAKKTGDFPSLSATDLSVMALTYQLEKEHVGSQHIRTEPVSQKTVNFVDMRKKDGQIHCDLPGWYYPKKHSKQENEDSDEEDCSDEEETEESDSGEEQEEPSTEKTEEDEKNEVKSTDDDLEALKEKFGKVEISVSEETDELVEQMLVKVKDEEELDDEGWITPKNVKRAKEIQLENAPETEDKEVKVACMTTDFAMQNVLKQMNLNIAALNGRMITRLKSHILRCTSCFKTTSIMTKVFCWKCGNPTLKKVAVSVDPEGNMVLHINKHKKLSGRGKRFSLPAIKGGKHPNNPILVEDQRIPHNRPSKKALQRTDALGDTYIEGYSPFATRDVVSRAAQLGYNSRSNKNKRNRRRK